MQIVESAIPGCFLVRAKLQGDDRGRLIKSYVASEFEDFGLHADWQEELHSSSTRGVVRGMHFQVPPREHAKLVLCVSGEVLDVVLDLRRGSPTFGEYREFRLRAEDGTGVYVPIGCAHGFAALGASNILFYKITSVHSPEHDRGIAINSFGYEVPFTDPIISKRDLHHPSLKDFETPFVFDAEAAS